jgi:type IV pilus assembly protein PilW
MSRQYIQKIKNTGFTLIEIMVSMVISSFVIAGMYSIYTIQQRSYTGQEQVAEMQQRARSALSFMSSEIRMAGYVGTCSEKMEIITAETQKFSFSYCDETDITTPVLSTNTFKLDDAYKDGVLDLVLTREKTGQNPTDMPVAEGVEAIEFRYLDRNGQVESDTTLIRTVQVSLLVRSSYPDPKYTDTITYKPASVRDAEQNGGKNVPGWDINDGSIPDSNPGTGNPPTSDDDKCDEVTDRCRYRRRLLITSIQLRNNI